MIRKAKEERAAEKLRSQKGASLFLALLFFLVCALAGLAILSTAQSYGKRAGTKAEEEAGYLALLSAVEFLKGQLNLCEGQWNTDASGMDVDAETENRVQKELLDAIHEFCYDYVNHPAKAEKEIYLTIALKDELAEELNGNQAMPDVEVRIIIEPDTKEKEWPEEQDEEIPIHIKAACSLKEKSGSTMSLTVTGTIVYQTEEWMEICWEEMAAGR